MSKPTSSKNLKRPAVKTAAVKKAANVTKSKKAPKKTASKSVVKKPVPAKKPQAKVAAAPAAKAKTPEKKIAPVKKAAAAPVPQAKDTKKAPPAPPAATKGCAKKEMEEKVVRGSAAVSKKSNQSASDGRPGAVATAAAKPVLPPLRVEPKIIETPQPEFVQRSPDETLFTTEELDNFRVQLFTERNKILQKARKAMEQGNIQIDKNEMMDEVDQASAMVEQNLTFRLLDRDRKLLSEIDHALAKIDSGDYGYCEGTGEPIPKRRLDLRPWCRHSVKYKEKLERMKKSGRGVVDEDEV